MVELRLDYLRDMDFQDPEPALTSLLDACEAAALPCIITLRPTWDGCAARMHAPSASALSGSLNQKKKRRLGAASPSKMRKDWRMLACMLARPTR